MNTSSHLFRIHVGTGTDRRGTPVSRDAATRGLARIKDDLSRYFGGCTVYYADGAWVDESLNSVVTEPCVTVEVVATVTANVPALPGEQTLEDARRVVRTVTKTLCTSLNQASVLVTEQPLAAAYSVTSAESDCVAYDEAAEAAGIVVDSFRWLTAAEAALGFGRPPGPRRTPSIMCESGRRPYCTCDTCY